MIVDTPAAWREAIRFRWISNAEGFEALRSITADHGVRWLSERLVKPPADSGEMIMEVTLEAPDRSRMTEARRSLGQYVHVIPPTPGMPAAPRSKAQRRPRRR